MGSRDNSKFRPRQPAAPAGRASRPRPRARVNARRRPFAGVAEDSVIRPGLLPARLTDRASVPPANPPPRVSQPACRVLPPVNPSPALKTIPPRQPVACPSGKPARQPVPADNPSRASANPPVGRSPLNPPPRVSQVAPVGPSRRSTRRLPVRQSPGQPVACPVRQSPRQPVACLSTDSRPAIVKVGRPDPVHAERRGGAKGPLLIRWISYSVMM
jgi:hypothetical protein